MKKHMRYLTFVVHVLLLAVAFFLFFLLFTGNGFFSEIYVLWSGFQLIFIVVSVLALPYYVRYISRLLDTKE